MAKKPTIKQALDCLVLVSKLHDIKFSINYKPKLHRWTQNPGWTIKAMDKTFCHVDDFIEAAGKAVAFIYTAHEANKA